MPYLTGNPQNGLGVPVQRLLIYGDGGAAQPQALPAESCTREASLPNRTGPLLAAAELHFYCLGC